MQFFYVIDILKTPITVENLVAFCIRLFTYCKQF